MQSAQEVGRWGRAGHKGVLCLSGTGLPVSPDHPGSLQQQQHEGPSLLKHRHPLWEAGRSPMGDSCGHGQPVCAPSGTGLTVVFLFFFFF